MDSSSKDGKVIIAYGALEMPAGDISSLDINAIKKYNFLWYLPILEYKLVTRREKDDPEYLDFLWRLSVLPYSLRATYFAYTEFMAKQRELIEKHKNVGELLMLSPPDAYELCFAIDHFLDSARKTQNSISTYISAALRQSLPKKMNHLIKGLMKGTHTLPYPLNIQLVQYWNKYGERLKQYRDISQHHALVASDIELFRTADDIICIKILLPSNPEVKKTNKLVWGSPEIHAQKFLNDQFLNLLGIMFVITKILAESLPGENKQMLDWLRRNPIVVGGRRTIVGHRPYTNDEIENNVFRILKQLDQKDYPLLKL